MADIEFEYAPAGQSPLEQYDALVDRSERQNRQDSLRQLERQLTAEPRLSRELAHMSKQGLTAARFGDYTVEDAAAALLLDAVLSGLGVRERFSDVQQARAAGALSGRTFTVEGAGGNIPKVSFDFFDQSSLSRVEVSVSDVSAESAERARAAIKNTPPESWLQAFGTELAARTDQLVEDLSEKSTTLVPESVPFLDLGDAGQTAQLTALLRTLAVAPFYYGSYSEPDTRAFIQGIPNGTTKLPRGAVLMNGTESLPESVLLPSGRNGVYVRLEGPAVTFGADSPVTTVRPSLVIDLERMDNGGHELPFLKSQTAQTLLEALAGQGLGLTDRLMMAVEERPHSEFRERYGNGYADLSRKLCSFIASDAQTAAHQLFGRELTADEITALRETAASAPDEPARMLLGLMADLVDRQEDPTVASRELYVSGKSLKDGGCKDVEAYFMQAQTMHNTTADEFFVSKTHGSHTALNKVPLLVNGVRIPAGFVCRVDEHGAVEPMRPTAFCFTEAQAADAFGDQYLELSEQPVW